MAREAEARAVAREAEARAAAREAAPKAEAQLVVAMEGGERSRRRRMAAAAWVAEVWVAEAWAAELWVAAVRAGARVGVVWVEAVMEEALSPTDTKVVWEATEMDA